MICPARLLAILLPLLLVASSIDAAPPPAAAETTLISGTESFANEAMLLVSLEDGTVIKQAISVDADVCFKQSSSTSTLCLTQGDAIVDPATNTVVGFEMIEERIDLIAKTD